SSLLDIPVFHDDQHGTAIVVLASLINAISLTKKDLSSRVVINGAGAAGLAIANLLHSYGFENILLCDSQGIISKKRDDLSIYKKRVLEFSNLENKEGDLKQALVGADIFIGVSRGDLLKASDISLMNK